MDEYSFLVARIIPDDDAPDLEGLAMTNDERQKLAELCGLKIGAGFRYSTGDPDQAYYLDNVNHFCWVSDWHPDTSIEQAFMVIAALRAKGFVVCLEHNHRQPDGSYLWQCVIVHENESRDDCYEANEKTPEEAICAAALKTLEVSNERK